jgi:hypothetical protein
MLRYAEARLKHRAFLTAAEVVTSQDRPRMKSEDSENGDRLNPLEVKFTGLTQNSQVDPAVRMKIPMKALELTQIMSQPCEFQDLASSPSGRGRLGRRGTTFGRSGVRFAGAARAPAHHVRVFGVSNTPDSHITRCF